MSFWVNVALTSWTFVHVWFYFAVDFVVCVCVCVCVCAFMLYALNFETMYM